MNDDIVWFDVVQERESEGAFLFVVEGEEMWIPKSQVRARRKDPAGKIVRCEFTRWIADKKGLLDGVGVYG